jgi:uncharacterized protein (TIGR01777 family)
MNILITGGTGLIGTRLCQQLYQLGHTLTVLSRKPETVPTFCKAIRSLDEWQPATHFDAVINLAGESIVDKAWTEARKKVLWDSRVGVTQSLVRCIEAADEKPRVFISGSAIGYYGNTGDKTLDEGAHVGKDFGAQLCDEWEKAALASSVRVCVLRTGLVLAPSGGFLKKMLPAFKLGVGGSMGSGQQWMSWIHIDDYIAVLIELLTNPNAQGAYNMTAPQPLTNQAFTEHLAKALNRRVFFSTPAWVLQLLLGERADLLLGGQRVFPVRVTDLGYTFKYHDLDDTLQALFNQKS